MTALVEARPVFAVRVDDFEGPLDLLLSLIAKHKLELTALSLHKVTDDFIAHIAGQGDDWDLDEATEFLVIAATLLDLKASRLLPTDEEPDPEDLELLEARDLLFSRLLQYRAYKLVSAQFEDALGRPRRSWPRTAGLDPHLHKLLPELRWTLTAQELFDLVVHAHTADEPPTVGVAHIHAAAVSVAEQAMLIAGRLRQRERSTFARLIVDCPDAAHVIGRFLAVLELFRAGMLECEQEAPMAELHLRWTGGDATDFVVDGFDEFDEAESL